MVNLEGMLEEDYGLVVGWVLRDALSISADGLTMVGSGHRWREELEIWCGEGWIATLPEPASVSILGPGGLMLRKKEHRISE